MLQEISDADPDAQDEAAMIDTYRYVSSGLPAASTAEREALLRLPLWGGKQWIRRRPIYAVDDPALTDALAAVLATWNSPASLASLGGLPAALGVSVLKRSAFVPAGIGPRAAVDGRDLEPVFRLAIRHLKARLQRNDPGLYKAIPTGWDALERAKVVVAPELTLEVQARDRSVTVPARAHVRPDPLPVLVCLVNSDEAGSDETTGRALAAIFEPTDPDGGTLDREKVALIWAAAWRLAARGEGADEIDLPSEVQTTDDVLSGIAADLAQGKRRGRVFESLTKPPAVTLRHVPGDPASTDVPGEPVRFRELKSASDLEVTHWQVVSPSGRKGTGAPANRTVTLRAVPTKTSDTSHAAPVSRSAPRGYTDPELETLATDVLRRVLRTASRKSDDFRAIRRLGADVVDDLGRYFEIKGSFGPGYDSITLTPHEAKRAQVAKRGEFFLAIVTGLEKGYETHVRIIPDPLDTLGWGEDGSLTLTGLRGAGIVVDIDLA